MYGIFTYIQLIFMVNVGKYTSPMDPMGTLLVGGFSPSHLKINAETNNPQFFLGENKIYLSCHHLD